MDRDPDESDADPQRWLERPYFLFVGSVFEKNPIESRETALLMTVAHAQLVRKCGKESKIPAIMAADALAGGMDTTANTGGCMNTEQPRHILTREMEIEEYNYKKRSHLRGLCHSPHRGVDAGRHSCNTTE
jgi:hypothetical protein